MQDDDVKVKRAYQTLLRLVGNVAKNPDMEKFRKIRISNPTFQVIYNHSRTRHFSYFDSLLPDD